MIKRALSVAVIALCCSASSANAGLLDGLWGRGGGCGCGCEPTCGCQPTCGCEAHCAPAPCEPSCGCPAPCCESSCHSCCRPDIAGWLRKLFSRPCNSCCQPTCEPSCSCEPSCACGH